jgi:polyhydroxybutyrate depolymerase
MSRHEQEVLMEHGGCRRRYLLHVPGGHDRSRPTPVVFMLHGAGGTAEIAARATRLSALADREGFFAIYPEAVRREPDRPARFLTNPPIWNDGSGRGFAGRQNVDDVGFIRAVLNQIDSQHRVDLARAYVAGFSNGGSMAFRLGVELADRVAALAVVAGPLISDRFALTRPVPLIYIAGSADPLNPEHGGAIRDPWGGTDKKPPVQTWPERWAAALGSTSGGEVLSQSGGVTTRIYSGGAAEVLFHMVHGAGHVWPGGDGVLSERIAGPATDRLDATAVIWEFFRGHPMKSGRPNASPRRSS